MANSPPVVLHPIADATVNEDTRWVLGIPAGTFQDPENAALTYTATLSTGAALPGWLVFNATLRIFAGTPPKNFNGALDLKVSVSDGTLSASDTFRLTVLPVNDAPVLAKPLATQTLVEDQTTAWRFQVASGTFTDVDSTNLTYSAELSDGTLLPSWIHFDPATQTFTGTPPHDFSGPLDVRLTATDGQLNTSGVFRINVTAVNDPPLLAMPIADRDAVKNDGTNQEKFTFRLPDGTFTDVDSTLTYSAKLAGGAALPTWLTFTGSTQTFSGIPPQGFTGALDIVVTASDGVASASDTFRLNVRATNQVPTLVHAIANQTINEDTPWSYKIPAGTFVDPEGTTLVYKAADAGHVTLTSTTAPKNQPLPDWLHFNPLTQTFTGTPTQDFNGTINIEVTVDDGSREVSDTFSLIVRPTPDAPEITNPLQDRYALEDAPLRFQIPAGSFEDPDGTALTYSARLVGGAALPSWLLFDPKTQTFSGTPPKNFNGKLNIQVTASDGALTTPDAFVLNVQPVNDPPVLARAIADTHIVAGVAFIYQIAAGTFSDVDNATLTYTATLSSGAALPSWLHFDVNTHTFSGTPPAGFTAPVEVKVVASDGAASASDVFVFGGSAPFVVTPIIDQTVGGGRTWTFTVPSSTFKDFDTTALAYSAILSDGTSLPSWLKFDAATRTFTGTPPANWDGHEDLRVIASDGSHSTSDTFSLDEKGDFTYHITGSMWGRSAPSEIHYRFDKLYFEASQDWQAGFDEGYSSGPIYGGIYGNAGANYNFQAGLLIDFDMKPDQINLTGSFDVVEHAATAAQVINTKPYVIVTGEWDNSSNFTLTAPTDAFALHAFAGVTATVGAHVGGGIYGGFETPDIDLGLLGSIDIPDITFSQDFDIPIGPFGIPKIEVGDGQVNVPPGGVIGAIDVNLKSSDPHYEIDLDNDGIGHISLGLPTGINASGYDIENVGANGLGSLVGGGTSDPFISASLDLDQLVIKGVEAATGVDLEKVFHAELKEDFGPFFISANLDSDFSLVGDLSLKEQVFFTPQISYTMTTSFGQTVTGQAGDKTEFNTPEGEGTFTVAGTYTSQADLTTVISLSGNIHFDFSLLKVSLKGGVDVGPINFTLAEKELFTAYQNSLSIVGIDIPVYSNTDHYVSDEVRHDTFIVPYEKFRTVAGSGDSFTFTTHQLVAVGNDHANTLTGNALANTILGGLGNDVLSGLGGDDRIDGSDGDDTLIGGAGFNTITGGIGNDTISSGDDGSKIDAGTGNDTITTGSGNDQITDLVGIAKISDSGGNNTIRVGDQGSTITVRSGNNTIISGIGVDVITTGNGADVINSGAGNDRINAGDGFNTITAGDGDDTIVSGHGGSKIDAGIGNDTISTGIGNDQIADLVGIAKINDAGGNNIIKVGDQGSTITVLSGNNTITSGAGADVITTGSGVDTINSGAGNDHINAGQGFNTITAGDGDDTIVSGNGGSKIDAGIGNDTITTGTGNDQITDLFGIVKINDAGGTNNIVLGDQGNTIALPVGNNTIVSGAGADVITTGSGVDTINSGAGNDSIKAGDGFNTITAGDGNDTIVSGNGGSKIDAGTGNDTITTGTGNDQITDLVGIAKINDAGGTNNIKVGDQGSTVTVLAGNNTITSGAGADVITTGSGVDTITSGAGNDHINAGDGLNTITAGAGDDVIVSGIVGSIIDSGIGVDTITTGVGNDHVTDAGGFTTIHDAGGSNTITLADGGVVTVLGSGNNTISSGSDFTGIADTITTGSGADQISAGVGNDHIDAGAGNDTVNGGFGSDVIIGGAGDDVMTGDIPQGSTDSDTFVFANGSGHDLIMDFGLGQDTIDLRGFTSIVGLEDIKYGGDVQGHSVLTLSPTDSIVFDNLFVNINNPAGDLARFHFLFFGTGNDTIVGTNGNDVLNGGPGADSMTGLKGDDAYKVDNAGDKVFENAGEGTDTLISTVSYVLAAHQSIEVIEAKSADGDINFTGNELDNTLLGNNGANVLTGGDGNDTLSGGAGADNLLGGNGNDKLDGGLGDDVLDGGAGNDTLTGGLDPDTLVFGGNDTLKGGDGNDTLDGGRGNDILIGGAGMDIMTGDKLNFTHPGGTDHDVFVFTATSDSLVSAPDQITDFTSGVDFIDISAIDADTTLAGHQTFTNLVASNPGKGEVAAYISGNSVFIDLNTNNDAAIEMRIELLNKPGLSGNDFILA